MQNYFGVDTLGLFLGNLGYFGALLGQFEAYLGHFGTLLGQLVESLGQLMALFLFSFFALFRQCGALCRHFWVCSGLGTFGDFWALFLNF